MINEDEKQAALKEYAAGRPQALEAYCRRVLGAIPGEAFAVAHLSNLLAERGDYAGAIALSEEGIKREPANASHYMNLAHFNIQIKRHQTALRHAREAVRLTPLSELAWVNLSSAAYCAEQFEESIAASNKALEINPKSFGGTNNLATAHKGIGDLPAAIAAYRRAMALDPKSVTPLTNLLLTMLYHAETPVSEVVETAKTYARQFEAPVVSKRKPHRNSALPDRRLRIGFLSPDFNNHAVMYFAEPVLYRLPRQDFEVYCYYTYAGADTTTERVKSLVDRFRYVMVSKPEQVAQTIQDDEIDILIDLAGHTAKNGLQAMCYKPAPVQVTWLGYPGTTGLSSIDWRVTDHIADPPGVEKDQYTEGLVRLPGCFCVYRPHIRDANQRFDPRYQVRETPALANGFITLGSCNNIAKLTAPTIAVWSQILRAMPTAKLLIEGKDFANPLSSKGLRAMLANNGIGEDRLKLVNRDPTNQYLTYHQIDIALDPFPLTGGTTTFDTLWMGVPVVSLLGRSYRERLSATILHNGGFGDDIATTQQAYIARVLALAADLPALNARRMAQRQKMQVSVLMDERKFVALFAKSLRGMWQNWCVRQEPQGLRPGELVVPGTDLLVYVNGKRITLPHALAWLERLKTRAATEDPQTAAQDNSITQQARSLSTAILTVVPEHPVVGMGSGL